MLEICNSDDNFTKSARQIIRDFSYIKKHPLSMLLINSCNLKSLSGWEKWLRRVVIFSENTELYSHLVTEALKRDYYSKFNLKIKYGHWNEIYENQTIAWPFDIIYVTLAKEAQGLVESTVVDILCKLQIVKSHNFIVVVQGYLEHSIMVKELLLKVGNFHSYRASIALEIKQRNSNNSTYFCVICFESLVSNLDIVFSNEEDEQITDVLLWGD